MDNVRGFTLVELMVTLVIAGILVAIGMPSFTTMIQNNRLSAQINQLTSLISFARSEAAKRPGTVITLCTTNGGSTCSNSALWESGWMIMTDADGDTILDTEDANGNGTLDNEDTNGNGSLDLGEDTNGNGVLDNEDLDNDGVMDADQVLLVVEALSGGNTLRSTGFANTNFIQFFDDGIPSSSGTFMLCDSRGATRAKGVVITISGQARLAVDENANNIVNTHAGSTTDVTCP
ncbi:MAG: GspH/FimT family pseudopilin [Hahellaceae bacterium]|nr:GspH/FimT family pseudopilin [Hahellaceae bacterium]MCP5170038.1 GspH/FimT family pseudopilin [Hahellaceae bacterium]